MCHATQFQLEPPVLDVVTLTITVIDPFGATVTVAPPLRVASVTLRSSLKVPLMDTAEVSPTAV